MSILTFTCIYECIKIVYIIFHILTTFHITFSSEADFFILFSLKIKCDCIFLSSYIKLFILEIITLYVTQKSILATLKKKKKFYNF